MSVIREIVRCKGITKTRLKLYFNKLHFYSGYTSSSCIKERRSRHILYSYEIIYITILQNVSSFLIRLYVTIVVVKKV